MNMKVCVLLSSYNGENFIKEQLDSIINQEKVSLDLIIRDDGSKDKTISILKDYEKKYDNITLCLGKNCGVKDSFAKLILNAGRYEYYAFADQDDIWYKDKLFCAIDVICKEKKDVPILYICNQNCVDIQGDFVYKRLPSYNIQPTIAHTLFQNEYSGCAMVFNYEMFKRIKYFYHYICGKDNILHDVCTMSIAQLTGNVIYDSVPHMDFRRHNSNCTESKMFEKMYFKEKIKSISRKIKTLYKFKGKKGKVRRRCSYFLECFSDEISNDDKICLEYFRDYNSSLYNWIDFLLKNKYKFAFPNPKLAIYLMIIMRIY